MARKKYDFVIIGGGLTGLICAQNFIAAGKKIALIDAGKKLGGHLQFKETKLGLLPMAFSKFPPSDLIDENVMRWIEKAVALETSCTKSPVRTRTFDSGKMKDFVGFGKKAPSFSEIITANANSEKLELTEGLSDIIARMATSLEKSDSCDIFLESQLSKLILKEERLHLAEINSSKSIEAENFLFTGSIKALIERQEGLVDDKLVQALAKTDFWTSIHLELVHKTQEADTDYDYILRGGTDSSTPCYGYFSDPSNFNGAQEDSFQLSQWVSFVEESLTNDMDVTGNLVREIRRQVKRAFPEAMSNQVFERISVHPSSHISRPVKSNQFRDNTLNNLFLVGRELDLAPNALGRIDSAVRLLDEIDVPLFGSKITEGYEETFVENNVEI